MPSTRFAPPPRGTHGFTLIELTVVLAVIVTLALILTPAIQNFITDSRIARTRSDTQTIASAVLQFNRDTGFWPQWTTAGTTGGAGTTANRVDLLVTPGNVPTTQQSTLWTTGTTDLLGDQVLSNTPGYTLKTATQPFGWNGPYLSSALLADAWGNRYMVNVGLLESTMGAANSAGTLKSAVWVISAGANGAMETVYQQPITTAVLGGDDVGVRIQ